MFIEYVVCSIIFYCISILLNSYSKEKELSWISSTGVVRSWGQSNGLYYINLTNLHLVLMIISIIVAPIGIACSLFVLVMTTINAIKAMLLESSNKKDSKLDKIMAWLSKPL